MIVQSLKAFGKEHLSAEIFAKIRGQIDAKNTSKILRDTQDSTGWVYEAIKDIMSNDEGIQL